MSWRFAIVFEGFGNYFDRNTFATNYAEINMSYRFEPITADDREAVIDIFNHFVENSFASYFTKKLPYEAFNRFLMLFADYPAITIRNEAGFTVGFAFMHAYHPADGMRHTAELTYFILPDYTGRGLGKLVLDYLTEEARERGISIFVAQISSLNEQSLNFHKKYGFREVGRLEKIGRKNGREYDVIWVQREI